MRWVLLAGLGLVLGSCSGAPPCSASTCTGCCDARGVCKTVTDNSACGRGGAACAVCGVTQTCSAGACVASGFGAGTSGTGGGTSGTGGGTSGTGGGTSGTGGGASGTGGGAAIDCTRPAEQNASGGCTINLVTPMNCQTTNFANGFIQLAWTTNQTFCEGPHKLYVAGSPVSSWNSGNVLEWSLTSGTYSNYAMTRNIGGYFNLTQADLARLTAVNGQYYFRVASFYDSESEIGTFIVR